MNERIKLLAEQALKHPDNDNDGLTVFDNDELEKFAELIVDECCIKLLDMHEKTKGHNNYYKHAALEIKKHFRGE
jgi:hypothetical protein